MTVGSEPEEDSGAEEELESGRANHKIKGEKNKLEVGDAKGSGLYIGII